MKKFSLLFLLMGFSCLSQSLHPYLQNPTPNSMFISWKTADNNTESTVQYGVSSTSLSITTTGTTSSYTDTGYGAGSYMYHKVKLTSLLPNTKYYYRVKTGTNYSAINSFKTLPNPGQAATADGHIRFLIFGDNQLIDPRYDSLVSAAKRKIRQKWGITNSIEDNISLIQMVGDQVDNGSLDHYENIHFKKVRPVSKNLAIQTIIGNHETYGSGVSSYYNHFMTNELSYQGIAAAGGPQNKDYYAYQAGNVLFIGFNTENTTNTTYHNVQYTWLQQVINAANADNTVDWIFTFGHRPYEAEQYVGDISQHVKNTYIPFLQTSSKFVLHVGAHHHIYSRGQFKNSPNYHIISGGTAWDQYWGMGTEQNFDYIQKTISNWMYQIVDVDVTNGKVDIESYSIGSIYKWKNNELMDTFHRYKNQLAPAKPSITNTFTENIQLPVTLNASSFSSLAGEQLNTSQFLVSKFSDFSIIEKESYRDFEDLFGKHTFPAPNAARKDSTVNVNLGVDITKLTFASGSLSNGTYYAKVRYRDRNLEWSQWSDVKTFTVDGSIVATPTLTLSNQIFSISSPITITYSNAPTTANTWVGVYKEGQSPGGPASTVWAYTNGSPNGNSNFATGVTAGGWYFVALFINNGYTEVATRQYFYVGSIPTISSDFPQYNLGDPINISYNNGPNLANDYIKIYKMGVSPGIAPATSVQLITTVSGVKQFLSVPIGYYYAEYYPQNSNRPIGNKIFFQVGQNITNLNIDNTVYNVGANLNATWTDGPGIVKDWLGIYPQGYDQDSEDLINYHYFEGLASGTKNIPLTKIDNSNIPAGNYLIMMFTDDSYTRVSNIVSFEIQNPLGNESFENQNSRNYKFKVFPNPTKNNNFTYFECEFPIDKIEIFDLSGKEIYTTTNINNNKYAVITQDLTKGVYIVKIHSNTIYTAKLVIE